MPTAVDLENNGNQKKYTVNRRTEGRVVISKPLCALMAIGALLLAILVGLLVFFFVPRCWADTPESLTKNGDSLVTNDYVSKTTQIGLKEAGGIDERLPRSIEPTHYRWAKFKKIIIIFLFRLSRLKCYIFFYNCNNKRIH